MYNQSITTPSSIRDNIIVIIDSLDRDIVNYPNPNEYIIKLPDVIRNAETIELMSLQLTRTENNVNNGNNAFKLIVGTTEHKITLNEEEIANGMLLATRITVAINMSEMIVTYDNTSMKLTFTNTDNNPFSIEVTENIAKLIGVSGTKYRGKGIVTSKLSVSGSTQVLVGNRSICLNGTPYIIMTINDYTRVISASNAAHKSFLVVPLENYKLKQRFIISGAETEKKGIYILSNNQKNIHEMRISFTRPDGSPYDFKGIDHLMSFRIYRDDKHDKHDISR